MTTQQVRSGWYRDPVGRSELRYFDGQWTDQVCNAGVVSREHVPTDLSTSSTTASNSDAGSRRRAKWVLAIGAGAAGLVATLAITLHAGGSSDGSFCAHYAQLGSLMNSNDLGLVGPADLQRVDSLLHKLAAEAPAAAKADLTRVADYVDSALVSGSSFDEDAAAQAAGDRVDVVAQRQCPGVGH